jgi:tetratricopeptide (TPR) repeat protein
MTFMQPGAVPPEERIGHYRLLSRLGSGGMGEVFLAHDEQLDRKVAIKRIRQETARPHQRERFRREARLAARLNHPNIVHVYDLLSGEDVDHLVLEYVEGTTLRVLLHGGPLPVPRVIDLGIQIAKGLQEAHRQGIVHRDLKTENVLVTDAGQAKIADFGIAKRVADDGTSDDGLTGTGAILGTYRAMSPEQARGELVDHHSDLFSFGVLLYEMLTGQSPFDAESGLAMLDRIVRCLQAPVLELRPEVPEELSRLIDRLLEKDTLLRPRGAGEAVQELEKIKGTKTKPESGESTIYEGRSREAQPRTAVPVQRRHPRAVLAFGLVLASALGLGGYFVLRPPPPPLYVAVLRPEIGSGSADGSANGEVDLLASGVRVALLDGLLTLEGISPKSLEEVDDAQGTSRDVARALSADELLSPRLDCRAETCRVALSRVDGQGNLLWADSVELPTDDFSLVARAVIRLLRRGYPDLRVRSGSLEPMGSNADFKELLRLRSKLDAGEDESLASILEELGALRRRSPRFLDVYLTEARAARQRFWETRNPDDLRRAFDVARQARDLAPEAPETLLLLTDIALAGRSLAEAEEALGRLDRLLPGDVRVLEKHAFLANAQGEPDKALALMREAVRSNPSVKRLYNLAQMEIQQGRFAEAREHLDVLLRRSPGNNLGRSLLATIELSHGDLGRAVKLYEDLVRKSPGLTELSNLGLGYFALERYAEAVRIYKQALEKAPGNPAFLLNLADSYWMMGDAGSASATYRKVLDAVAADLAAGLPAMLTVKGQALAHLGRGTEAVAAVQEALRLAPNQGSVAYEASLVYAVLGEQSSALVNARKALELGYEARWFDFPWFQSLRQSPELRKLLSTEPPG